MEFLSVCLTLGLLTLSSAVPMNMNSTTPRHIGPCEHMKQKDHFDHGGFIPECDYYGNYIPQQCWDGYCWCVNVITGHEIPGTKAMQGEFHYECGKETYCPYEWTPYGRKCFMFIDSPKSWVEAEGYCLFEGGNLASIHSYEENHFVQGLTRGYTHEFPLTWVGGQDAIQNCFWMWSDGTKFNYEKWYKENDMARTEHCLLINYGYEWEWNYASCNETLPFVCVKSSWRKEQLF